MTDAKPVEVGAHVSILREYAAGWRAIGCSCGDCPTCSARSLIDSTLADGIADALIAQQAEIARLTQENARLVGEVDNWRKKYGNDKPWDSPSSRTPIPTAIITKARRDEQ